MHGESFKAYRIKISILEQELLLNIQLDVICADMVDFRRLGHIYNLTNNTVVIVGFKIFIDLFDVVCTLVVYITYNMGKRDLLDIYTLTLGLAALRLRYIY